jgi:hypothetical protein
MHFHSIKFKRLVTALPLLFCRQIAFAQIDLFGNIANTLDNQFKHASPPFDSTRVFDIG